MLQGPVPDVRNLEAITDHLIFDESDCETRLQDSIRYAEHQGDTGSAKGYNARQFLSAAAAICEEGGDDGQGDSGQQDRQRPHELHDEQLQPTTEVSAPLVPLRQGRMHIITDILDQPHAITEQDQKAK